VREGVDPEDALRMITRQPARFLGVLDRVGSIERGKDADLVILSGEPFTPGARVLMTMIDGKILETEGSR
jgi:imidazolonepropionase-like amidohydrolase